MNAISKQLVDGQRQSDARLKWRDTTTKGFDVRNGVTAVSLMARPKDGSSDGKDPAPWKGTTPGRVENAAALTPRLGAERVHTLGFSPEDRNDPILQAALSRIPSVQELLREAGQSGAAEDPAFYVSALLTVQKDADGTRTLSVCVVNPYAIQPSKILYKLFVVPPASVVQDPVTSRAMLVRQDDFQPERVRRGETPKKVRWDESVVSQFITSEQQAFENTRRPLLPEERAQVDRAMKDVRVIRPGETQAELDAQKTPDTPIARAPKPGATVSDSSNNPKSPLYKRNRQKSE